MPRPHEAGTSTRDDDPSLVGFDTGPIPLGVTLDKKYHVRRVLGRGSMGIVYLGNDVGLERDIAIKVLLPRYAADRRVAKRFKREAVAMASVRAENVVQIFSYGDYGNHPYFVMEYVPGYTVASLIENANQRGEHLYLDVVLGILRQVARGIHAVHELGIVHRDVKPANMLVGPRFKVSITDFGLVETLQDSDGPRDLAGTPLYLAPELIRRQQLPDEQRYLSDVYALGVSAYEMLTGDVPFDGDSIRQILRRHLDDKHLPVSEVRSDLPPAVDHVIERALAKEPTQRFSSCLEFIEALEASRSGRLHAIAAASPAPDMVRSSLRIIIAEDDRETRHTYRTALKVGFPHAAIHTASDGLKALELTRSSRPDLVLVDIDMPRMNGLELCAALRGDEYTTEIPIIVVADALDNNVRSVLRKMGIRELLRKPVELSYLVSLARAQVDQNG